jgi:hypothetical protein
MDTGSIILRVLVAVSFSGLAILTSGAEEDHDPFSDKPPPSEIKIKRIADSLGSQTAGRILYHAQVTRTAEFTRNNNEGLGFSSNLDGFTVRQLRVLPAPRTAEIVALLINMDNFGEFHDPQRREQLKHMRTFGGVEITDGRGFVRFYFVPGLKVGWFFFSDGLGTSVLTLSDSFVERFQALTSEKK